MSEIIKQLSEIQSELKAPKSQYNAFGKYNYRNCEDILEALKPILRQRGMAVTITDTVKQIGERYYIEATATLHSGEESINSVALAREDAAQKGKDASQITGSASSYARKYALNGLFAIDDTKDSDGADNTQLSPDPPVVNPPAGIDKTSKIFCTSCGKEIKALKNKEGQLIQPEQVSAQTGGLCMGCYRVNAE